MFFAIQVHPEVKARILNRVIAKAIDLLIVFLLAMVLFYPLGPLFGFLYSLLSDGMDFGPFKGQSVGKKIMGFRVVSLVRREPANFKDSALRNMPVGLVTFFALIPFWGWIIMALLGIPLMLMEVYLMLRVETHHRLGDLMGDTEVVEGS